MIVSKSRHILQELGTAHNCVSRRLVGAAKRAMVMVTVMVMVTLTHKSTIRSVHPM
jgi:hypothetical protein